jgi:hypothetical protein
VRVDFVQSLCVLGSPLSRRFFTVFKSEEILEFLFRKSQSQVLTLNTVAVPMHGDLFAMRVDLLDHAKDGRL